MFAPQTDTSIAEPVGAQMDELGNTITQMYHFIAEVDDQTLPGLESSLNYMNECYFSKDDPAINEHHYHITKQQYNQETHNIYKGNKNQNVQY